MRFKHFFYICFFFSLAQAVTWTDSGTIIILDNGILRARIERSSANVISIMVHGQEILQQWTSDNPSHIGIYHDLESNKGLRGLKISSVKPVKNESDLIDLCFSMPYSGDTDQYACDFEMHFALAKGDSGLYQYSVLHHKAQYPDFTMGFWRSMVWPPYDSMEYFFDWAHVDSLRNFRMPSRWDDDHANKTGIKEIVQLNSGTRKGMFDGKYNYSADLWGLDAFGVSSDVHKMGLFVVYGAHEWIGYGPIQQELNVGPGAIHILANPGHYGCPSFTVQKGTEWHKVFGPWLIYVNRGTDPQSLWADAKARAATERGKWPYNWVSDTGYHTSDRGRVSGCLKVIDSLKPSLSLEKFWIGLAQIDSEIDSSATDPQFESRGYQYWVHSDAGGKFEINNIRPGKYSLFAWGPGEVDQFRKDSVIVKSLKSTVLDSLRWIIPRKNGSFAFEIGIPDRKSSEFAGGKTFFEGFTWNDYHTKFSNPLVYTVGKSDWHKDWNYVQDNWSQPISDSLTTSTTWPWQNTNDYKKWPWEIHFNLSDPGTSATDTSLLTIAISSAQDSRLDISLDDESVENYYPHRSGGNALARQSDHAKYDLHYIKIPNSRLKAGDHVLKLTEGRIDDFQLHIMYDYISLEVPRTISGISNRGQSFAPQTNVRFVKRGIEAQTDVRSRAPDVVIYALNGRVFYKGEMKSTGTAGQWFLSVPPHGNGIFFVKVQNGNEIKSSQMIYKIF